MLLITLVMYVCILSVYRAFKYYLVLYSIAHSCHDEQATEASHHHRVDHDYYLKYTGVGTRYQTKSQRQTNVTTRVSAVCVFIKLHITAQQAGMPCHPVNGHPMLYCKYSKTSALITRDKDKDKGARALV